jgi:NTP pyrophosphatase (non-canonical NTP hydrolase)
MTGKNMFYTARNIIYNDNFTREEKVSSLIAFFLNDPTAISDVTTAEFSLFRIVEFLFNENKALKKRIEKIESQEWIAIREFLKEFNETWWIPRVKGKVIKAPRMKLEKESQGVVKMAIKAVAMSCHENARKHGFWDVERNQGEMIALMHSELSEALEAMRKGNKKSEHIPEFSGVEEEMADVLIRVFDFCAGFGYRLEEALIAKMKFNASREYMHGKGF